MKTGLSNCASFAQFSRRKQTFDIIVVRMVLEKTLESAGF